MKCSGPRTTISLRTVIATLRQHESFLARLAKSSTIGSDDKSSIENWLEHAEWFRNLYPEIPRAESPPSPTEGMSRREGIASMRRTESSESKGKAREIVQEDMPSMDISQMAEAEDEIGEEKKGEDDLDEMLMLLSMDDTGRVSRTVTGR